MTEEIVKVQIPLTGEKAPMLVYGKHHKNLMSIPYNKKIAEQLKEDYKGYFKATWNILGYWDIGDRTKNQSW